MKLIFLMALMAVSLIPVAYADISVIQDNLNVAEQKVLDDIALAKADGTYIAPPEAPLTATIQKYSEDVVIQAPFPVAEWYCGEKIFKSGIPELTCVIVGKAPADSIWNEQTSEWIAESVIAEETEKQEAQKAAELLTDDQKRLQAVQNLINDLKTDTRLTVDEQQAIKHFSNLTLCMRGLEDTEAMQSRGNFIIPVESLELVDGQWVLLLPEIDDGKSLDFNRHGVFGKLYMAAQECEAQIKLMGFVSPDHYRNMIMGEDDFQPKHQDMASLDKGIEAFGIDFTDRHDGSLVDEAEKAKFALCLSDKVTDQFKKDLGYCPDPYLGLYKPAAEPTGFIMDTTSPMIKHEKHAIVCGLLPDNDHIVNELYWEYMIDLQNRFNCAHWDRVQGIMLFDEYNWNQSMIDEQIKKYQESQQ